MDVVSFQCFITKGFWVWELFVSEDCCGEWFGALLVRVILLPLGDIGMVPDVGIISGL